MRHFTHPRHLQGCAAILTLTALLCGQAIAQEGIVRNPVTGDYVITYQAYDPDTGNYDAGLSETTYIPAIKIAPSVQSSFRLSHKGVVDYRYAVSNGATAQDSLIAFILDGIPNLLLEEIAESANETKAQLHARSIAEDRAVISPLNWGHSIYRDNGKYPDRVLWNTFVPRDNPGIPAGGKISGFGLASQDLPGLIQSKLHALGSGTVFADEGPQEGTPLYAQLDNIRDNDFVPRVAAAPLIVVPVPFDAAVLLDRIRGHLNTWVSMPTTGYNGNVPPDKKIFLLDATYAAKLDGYLSSAANAFRMNQPKVAQEQIEVVRKLLAKEHHHIDHDDEDDEDTEEHKKATRFTIDRLAARVLDFDLRYVLKRTERDHEEREKKTDR